MTKFFLFVVVFVFATGCTSAIMNNSTNIQTPAMTIKNPKCNHLKAAKVFDVSDDFVLANGCVSSTDFCPGYEVYIKKENNEIYYEGKIIRPIHDKCFAYEGAYKYETVSGFINSIPKLISVDAKIINPEYRVWEQQQSIKQ